MNWKQAKYKAKHKTKKCFIVPVVKNGDRVEFELFSSIPKSNHRLSGFSIWRWRNGKFRRVGIYF